MAHYAKETIHGRELTERERDCLRLMAQGLENAEIGTEMQLSVNTVKVHVANVLGKLGARNRTHAAILGHQLGLLDFGIAQTGE